MSWVQIPPEATHFHFFITSGVFLSFFLSFHLKCYHIPYYEHNTCTCIYVCVNCYTILIIHVYIYMYMCQYVYMSHSILSIAPYISFSYLSFQQFHERFEISVNQLSKLHLCRYLEVSIQ